jgi:hypothetical protein
VNVNAPPAPDVVTGVYGEPLPSGAIEIVMPLRPALVSKSTTVPLAETGDADAVGVAVAEPVGVAVAEPVGVAVAVAVGLAVALPELVGEAEGLADEDADAVDEGFAVGVGPGAMPAVLPPPVHPAATTSAAAAKTT